MTTLLTKATFCAFFLCTFLSISSAQELIHPCETGDPLLSLVVSDYKPTLYLLYDDMRDTMYARVDGHDGVLNCIYSNYTINLDPNIDPSSSAYFQGINAEHTFPRSKGAQDEPALSDMHSIFPCKDNINSDRSNCDFNEIDDATTGFWYKEDVILNAIPTTDIDLYCEKDLSGFDCGYFEPRESVKGDVARAVFYFYTMYKAQADATFDPDFFHRQKELLLQWHDNDPATQEEIDRSDRVALYQSGKPNPFVVDSTLARRCYFSTSTDLIPQATASVLSGNVVKLQWNVINTARRYRIRININGAWVEYLTAGVETFRFLNQLDPSTTYEYQIKSLCETGSSAWSASEFFTTTNDICDIPASTGTSGVSSSEATIYWSAFADDIKYKVKYKPVSGGSWVETIVNTTQRLASPLLPNTLYKYKLKTKCSAGYTNWSSNYNFTTAAFNAPTTLRLQADDEAVSIFPNPAKDVLNINFNSDKASSISVISSTGKVIKHLETTNNQNSMSISALEVGLYIVRIQFKDQSIRMEKFVKAHQ